MNANTIAAVESNNKMVTSKKIVDTQYIESRIADLKKAIRDKKAARECAKELIKLRKERIRIEQEELTKNIEDLENLNICISDMQNAIDGYTSKLENINNYNPMSLAPTEYSEVTFRNSNKHDKKVKKSAYTHNNTPESYANAAKLLFKKGSVSLNAEDIKPICKKIRKVYCQSDPNKFVYMPDYNTYITNQNIKDLGFIYTNICMVKRNIANYVFKEYFSMEIVPQDLKYSNPF